MEDKNKTYSIFGAGAAGLYTAWRLLQGKPASTKDKTKNLKKGDVLELYDWGNYQFSKKEKGTRAAGARVCTWHYNNDPEASYLELGGMRYSAWDYKKTKNNPNPNNGNNPGHRLVTKTISEIGLEKYSVPFNEASNPLLSLRAKSMYTSDINAQNPAPYNTNNYGEDSAPDFGFTKIESVGIDVSEDALPPTRNEWCKFYEEGKITKDLGDQSIFKKGQKLKDIGYWNLAYDVLGQEGFSYLADGNGYSSNVVNTNSAQSFEVNNEFTPGTLYKTLTIGYSGIFSTLFQEIVKLSEEKGVCFEYHPNTRLRSILENKNTIHYTTASREEPTKELDSKTCDAAFLAMGRYAIDLVAQATRYMNKKQDDFDVLNDDKVQLYLESVLMQPSYKIGMFFDSPWWRDDIPSPPKYPAKLNSYFLTQEGIKALKKDNFPVKYIKAIEKAASDAAKAKLKAEKENKAYDNSVTSIIDVSFATETDFLKTAEAIVKANFSYNEKQQITKIAHLDTIGPSATDMPIRQVVYFGDNARNKKSKKVYGILASYDDIRYTTFWKALEIGPNKECKIAESQNTQPLQGPRKAPAIMVKMLRQQLANLHFGSQASYTAVPEPLETRYIDWSLPPFNAGYHAYFSHYNIGDVQQKIRKPSSLVKGKDSNLFIIGSTYSNDQAWVEGAFCTAESVLNDFFNIEKLIDDKEYPFICPA
ncbi:Amine oxidase, flavin-containing [Tenacibaculum discolor]